MTPTDAKPILNVFMQIMMWSGVIAIAAYLLLGRTRSYLLYLGVGLLGVAISTIRMPVLHWTGIAFALFFFILAFLDMLQETRERLERLRGEQRDREAAFSELQMALARKETAVAQEKNAGTPADAE